MFNPNRELERIKTAPKIPSPENGDQLSRKEKVKEFKERLMRQKEGIGMAIETLRSTVEKNPNATEEELQKIVDAYAEEYEFTEGYKITFQDGIRAYVAKHAAVEKYRALYPDDSELYQACFNKKPRGKIEVIRGADEFILPVFSPG